MVHSEQVPITIASLTERYKAGDITPRQVVLDILQRAQIAQEEEQNPVWLYLLSAAEVEPYLAYIEGNAAADLPLYGVPFAIKDNIDLAGIPTTAACAQFTYIPDRSAFVVEQLLAAGAIPLGKTNLDQFATGLVGVRSPFGVCKNALNSAYISGGSSSGSAVAVAKRWAAFALGTDTAGSGRVPAALNHLVGLKPSRGLLSNRGLVPACKSLDCISVFTHTLDDANRVFDAVAQFDQLDPYARANPYGNGKRYGIAPPEHCVIGVPRASQLAFFGDQESELLFESTVKAAREAGAEIKEIDFQPFLDAAQLLYAGPWVAERYIATKALSENKPGALLPITHEIISKGKAFTAVDTFEAQYLLQSCQQRADAILAEVDCIMTPTIGTDYTIAAVAAEPLQLNSNLGYYTNFMNLLDCAAIALPTAYKRSGVGFGVTLFHQAFSDKRLLAYANKLLSAINPSNGGNGALPARPKSSSTLEVAVCGAHLEGLPLNWQLRERGAQKVRATATAPHYRLYALHGGAVARPGLIRDERGGQAIEVEVWRLPTAEFGSFVAEIPAPLAIGKVELADGGWCCGFVCEGYGLTGAEEITDLHGWREYLAQPRR